MKTKEKNSFSMRVSGVSDIPPVEAGLELSTGVQRAAVQRHDAFTLQLRERLSPVFQLTRYRTQSVIHPRCHLHTRKRSTCIFLLKRELPHYALFHCTTLHEKSLTLLDSVATVARILLADKSVIFSLFSPRKDTRG